MLGGVSRPGAGSPSSPRVRHRRPECPPRAATQDALPPQQVMPAPVTWCHHGSSSETCCTGGWPSSHPLPGMSSNPRPRREAGAQHQPCCLHNGLDGRMGMGEVLFSTEKKFPSISGTLHGPAHRPLPKTTASSLSKNRGSCARLTLFCTFSQQGCSRNKMEVQRVHRPFPQGDPAES